MGRSFLSFQIERLCQSTVQSQFCLVNLYLEGWGIFMSCYLHLFLQFDFVIGFKTKITIYWTNVICEVNVTTIEHINDTARSFPAIKNN